MNTIIIVFRVRPSLNLLATLCTELDAEVSVLLQRTMFRASNLLGLVFLLKDSKTSALSPVSYIFRHGQTQKTTIVVLIKFID